MSTKITLLSCLFFSFYLNLIHAQTSGIKGAVIDDKTGQPVPGATVVLNGQNKSTVTNPDGNFIFSKLNEGTYDITVSGFTYQSKEVTEIIVKKDELFYITISLEEKKNELKEIVITTTRAKVESVKSLLTQQKNSPNVSDGISAETIRRTPDKNTSDVLKRISGASIQENRFVIVRGLNDRYNTALVNGSPLPSSEPDRKAFSFDIFPSNMIDNLVITKTATPDLPGEFAGGIIQINTKSVPDKDFQTISIGSGYNTITTFKTQKTYEGTPTDFLGFDNGKRDLAPTIPSSEIMRNLPVTERAEIAKTFEYDWSIKDQRFAPNTSFQYAIGRHWDIGEKVIGLLFSATHSISNNFNNTLRNDYELTPVELNLPNVLTGFNNDNNYTTQLLTGGILNTSIKFNEHNNINFKNIFSLNSSDLVVEREGKREIDDSRVIFSDVRWFTSNRIYSGQLNGEHFFTKPKIKINWTGFYSDIKRDIPNLRRNIYSVANPNGTDLFEVTPFAEITTNNGGPDYGGGMFFSENNEILKGAKLDVAKKFNIGDEVVNELKIGGFNQLRDRTFFARQLQYNTYGNFDFNLLTQPNETIFNIQNMGLLPSGSNGFTLFEFTKPTDEYVASSDLNAAYLMLDNRYKNFRLVWGARIESYKQNLDATLDNGNPLAVRVNQTDILPSANLIFSINKKQNLRLSYSKTLNRPEFRELAPFGFYDFTTQFFTQGNPNLKIAKIQNLDLRYEIYPGKGQLFSVSYFRKSFKDPIEIRREVNNKTVTYQNASSAINKGVEIEFRTLLSSIFGTESSSSLLDDITLFSNLAIIKSQVDVSNINVPSQEQNRPLQGQSPYVFNAGLQYINKDNGWAISTNVNRVGDRIAFGAGEIDPALWEKARTFIDMQIAKSFYKNKIEVKLNIQNLLAQDLVFYQNNYRNSIDENSSFTNLVNNIFVGNGSNRDGYDSRYDDKVWITKFGQSLSFSISYNF
jgi:hypothetical protein